MTGTRDNTKIKDVKGETQIMVKFMEGGKGRKIERCEEESDNLITRSRSENNGRGERRHFLSPSLSLFHSLSLSLLSLSLSLLSLPYLSLSLSIYLSTCPSH